MDAKELYLIQSGLIEIGKLTSDGKDLTLRICQKRYCRGIDAIHR